MTTKTLAEIDATKIADEVTRRVLDHIAALCMSIGAEWRADAQPSTLRYEALALALYAQRGCSPEQPAGDWTTSGMAADGLLAVLAALYSRAADGGLEQTAIDVIDDEPIDSDLALVLVAAAARIRIDQRTPVSARELAALAGLDPARVRQLIRGGELAATDERPARVKAGATRRWLEQRRVPGFAR